MHVNLDYAFANGRVHGTVTYRADESAPFEGWIQLIALLEKATSAASTPESNDSSIGKSEPPVSDNEPHHATS